MVYLCFSTVKTKYSIAKQTYDIGGVKKNRVIVVHIVTGRNICKTLSTIVFSAFP